MDKDRIKATIREIARGGYTVPRAHCKERMKERNVTIQDLFHVLFWGEIESIESDNQHNNLKCTLNGTDIDGEKLTVQVAVQEDDFTLFCITVY